jgi:hypothetical protein
MRGLVTLLSFIAYVFKASFSYPFWLHHDAGAAFLSDENIMLTTIISLKILLLSLQFAHFIFTLKQKNNFRIPFTIAKNLRIPVSQLTVTSLYMR